MQPIPQPVKQFIEHAPRLATVRPSGHPHVIPVCPAFDCDVTMFVDIAGVGVSGVGIAADPSVTALVDEYDDERSIRRQNLSDLPD